MSNAGALFALIGLARSHWICKRVTEASDTFRASTTAGKIEKNTLIISLLSNGVGNSAQVMELRKTDAIIFCASELEKIQSCRPVLYAMFCFEVATNRFTLEVACATNVDLRRTRHGCTWG